jgi:UDPglucose--hexose-1-phosphate uridylyltransferase
MEPGNLYQSPHRRFNPLTRDWILVSPHRTERPWQGRLEAATSAPALTYDPSCYLCPANHSSSSARRPGQAARRDGLDS